MKITNDIQRMAAWLALGLAAYACAAMIGPELPAIQTVFWKIGHVTTLAWVGYWVGRQALGRLEFGASGLDRLARAVIMAGVIMAGSMGL